MTNKEKNAIDDLKEVVELYNNKCLITTEDDFKSIEILLNLIEKQSKEIEELKEVKWYYEISRVPKDKIKARIEEYENKIKKIRSKKLINEPEDTIVITRYAHYISVLQSLLEKE